MLDGAHDHGSDVHSDKTSLPTTSQLSLFGALRRWYSCSVLRLSLEELRTLPYRILEVRRIGEVERRGYVGSGCAGSPSVPVHLPKTWKPAYIRYMQQLHASLTTFDRLLVERAWKDGLALSVHTDTPQSPQIYSSVTNGSAFAQSEIGPVRMAPSRVAEPDVQLHPASQSDARS